MPFLFFLIVFAVATLILKYYYLAAAEGVAIFALIIYSFINRSRKRKALKAYIESVTYDTETAKNNTLMNFQIKRLTHRVGQREVFLDMRP